MFENGSSRRYSSGQIMSDLDAPATKQDIHDLRHELDKLNVKIDAYWTASDRVQRLAFGMLATAVIAIVVTAVTLILRG
jgi:hypothetical protein